jgi:hypothetical protein
LLDCRPAGSAFPLNCAQRLPVNFAAGCSGLGRELDPSCDTDDVRARGRGGARDSFACCTPVSNLACKAGRAPDRQRADTLPRTRAACRQLPRNAAVELPLWLFPELHERNMVVPKMPKHFGKRCASTRCCPLPV